MSSEPIYRKAAETALIDKDAVGVFAERLFKPSLEQVMQKLRSKADLSGEALQKKALDEMRLPAVGCFVAGTLVHTKSALQNPASPHKHWVCAVSPTAPSPENQFTSH